jgi:hypothetical protein
MKIKTISFSVNAQNLKPMKRNDGTIFIIVMKYMHIYVEIRLIHLIFVKLASLKNSYWKRNKNNIISNALHPNVLLVNVKYQNVLTGTPNKEKGPSLSTVRCNPSHTGESTSCAV